MSTSQKKKTTIQFQEGGEMVAPELPPEPERGLAVIVIPPADLVPLTSGRALMKRTAAHTKRCRCVRCRKRPAHERAGRASVPPSKDYIDAEIISITSVDGGTTTRPGHNTPPPWSGYSGPGRGAATTVRGLRLRSRKRYRFFVTAGLLVLLLLVLAAFSGPGGWFVDALFPPSATITITPKSTQESRAVSVTAVTGRPGPNQVAARFISASSSLAVVAKSTGSEQTPALASQGSLTFYNEASSPQTVAAGTVLKGNDGVEVITDATVTVPAGNPPSVGIALTSAHAVQAGGQTNMGALDINGLCCAAGLAVKNTAPFSGGQDAQTYPVLEQHDIERAAGTVQQKLHQRVQLALEGQLSSSQQLANTPLCHATVKPVDIAGSKVTQTSVSVAVTCAVEAYDALAARHAAATLFEQQVDGQLGTAYQLISSISTGIPKASRANNQQGTLTLLVQTGATWGYQFTADEKRELARTIEGKPVANALTSIAGMPGVEHCSIQVSGGAQTVPMDATHISIVIRPSKKGGP